MHVSTLWTWLYWAWVASEIFIAIATRTRGQAGEARDRGTQLLLWIVIVLSLVAAGWAKTALPTRMFGATHWLKVGLLFLAAGLAIRWTAILHLGKAFSANVAIRASQKLQDTGLYRYVRHPSYLGLLIIFLAIGVYSRNWISLLIVLTLPTMALIYRIHVEEAALRDAFGEEYATYSRKTRRLIPGVY